MHMIDAGSKLLLMSRPGALLLLVAACCCIEGNGVLRRLD